jgi:hypothetical protein
MGIISSLFGSGTPQPTVGGQAVAVQELPAELKPYYKDILGKAQALYKTKTDEGYQRYAQPTIAKFTPEQEAAFTGIAGLQGQVAPQFQQARTFTTAGAAPITTEDITAKMSPYQQAVIDLEKAEAQKTFESKQLPEVRKAQIAAGAFGGTRGTLLEAQTLANQQKLLADIQTRGSQAAYSQALQQAASERQRLGQAGAQLATIAPTELKARLGEIGAYQQVGAAKQRQTQQALDEAYRQFIQEQQYPYEALGKYQAVVTGAPIRTTQFAPPPPPPPSLGQQLIGGLGTIGATYGAFGGDPLAAGAKLFGLKGGGGISDVLPIVYRQNPGMVGDDYGGVGDMRTHLQHSLYKFGKETTPEEYDLETYLGTGLTGVRTAQKDVETQLGLVQKEIDKLPTRKEKEDAITNFLANQREGIKAYQQAETESLEKEQLQDEAERAAFYGDREKALEAEKLAAAKAGKQAQYGNLAQFFARLGTASPKQGGLRGILGAGLEAAEETLPEVMATQKQIKEEQKEADQRKEQLAIAQRGEKVSNIREVRAIKKDLRSKVFDKNQALDEREFKDLNDAANIDLENAKENLNLSIGKGASAENIANLEIKVLEAKAEVSLARLASRPDLAEKLPVSKDVIDQMKLIKPDWFESIPGFTKAIEKVVRENYITMTNELQTLDVDTRNVNKEMLGQILIDYSMKDPKIQALIQGGAKIGGDSKTKGEGAGVGGLEATGAQLAPEESAE